ncbi:hypothetical protein C922_05876, partial [Plasmodium inui San Antonio 1]
MITEQKTLLAKQIEESKKLKEYFFHNDGDTNKLNLENIQGVPFGDDISPDYMIDVLGKILLQQPKAVGEELKKFENAITGTGPMTESTWKEVKHTLLEKGSEKRENQKSQVGNGQRKIGNDTKKAEYALKSLKDNMSNNPFVKQIMLNELEDVSLARKFKHEYVLEELNKEVIINRL